MKTRPDKGNGMKTEKKLRQQLVQSLNQLINKLRKAANR